METKYNHIYVKMKDGSLKRVLVTKCKVVGASVFMTIGFGYENLYKIKMEENKDE